MNRRFFLGTSAAAVAATSFAAKKKQPNILWMVTDDQRPDSLACYNEAVRGSKLSALGYVMSPHIDRLAKQGTLFTQAYCNAPACAPSRASMHYGQYPFRCGIYGFEQNHQAADPVKQTVPQVMREAGYTTSQFGKHGYYVFDWGPGLTWNTVDQYDVVVEKKNDLQKSGKTDFFPEVIWDKEGSKRVERFYYPDGSTKAFYTSRGKNKQLLPEDAENRDAIDKDRDILRAYTRDQGGMILAGESSQPPDKTLDGEIANAFIDYMESGADDQPQFIYLGFHFPHTPVLPPKKYRNIFKSKEREIPYRIPEFSADEVNKMPPQLQELHKKMNCSNLKKDEKLQAIRDYYAFCAHGDAQMGRSIDAFIKYCTKKKEDWVIVYVCGDHSWHLGEQGIEAKFGPWRQSTQSAVVAASSIPNMFPKNKATDSLVEFVDFAATFYETGGVNVRDKKYDYLDGTNLSLTAAGKAKREYILGEMNHVVGPRAYMRSHDWAFSMKTREKNGKPGDKWGNAPGENIKWALACPRDQAEMCLYDLRVDPDERWNVANDPKYVKLADWFRQKMGNIVLGDRRAEINWAKENEFVITDFALGADDKKLDIPAGIIPQV